MKRIAALSATVALVAIIAGCVTTAQLDPAGVYAGQSFLYNTDTTLANAKDDLNNFVTWEYQNRAALTGNLAQVTVAADAIRTSAPLWFQVAKAARDTYASLLTNTTATATQLAAASNNVVAQAAIIQGQATVAKALQTSTVIPK